jgi:hypothetical protein
VSLSSSESTSSTIGCLLDPATGADEEEANPDDPLAAAEDEAAALPFERRDLLILVRHTGHVLAEWSHC